MREEDQTILKRLCLLSAKRVLYACNIAEEDLVKPSKNEFVRLVRSMQGNIMEPGTSMSLLRSKLN